MRFFPLLLLFTALMHGDVIVNVSLNTSPLTADSGGGPYSLDFQMIDGSGTGDANNTITLSNFAFGGGSVSGAPVITGGVSGDLTSSVSLTDSQFFNEFTEGFKPGESLN